VRVIWVNGAFGAGKTTLSERLLAEDPRLLLFDAELPGYMVREIVPLPPSGYFQDLRVWRRSVVDTAVALLQEYGLSFPRFCGAVVTCLRSGQG
jgi:adenylylsulfate kinase-like enzyme